MCNFLSAILTKSGELFCDPEYTDSHEDLIIANNIHDDQLQYGRFARVEFTPSKNTTIQDLSSWTLVVEEFETVSDWINLDELRNRLEIIVRRMLIADKRKFLLGGCYILCGKARIDKIKNTKIALMYNSSQVVNDQRNNINK